MIPAQGFFPRYVKYASELTDAPEVFHVAAALAVHSAVCAKYTEVRYLTRSHGKLLYSWTPTHLWSFLIGPSSHSRKTTAINLASEVVKPIVAAQKINFTSPSSTFGLVASHPDAYLEYPEGGSLIAMIGAPYWAEGRGLLSQLYDGKDMKKELIGSPTKAQPNPPPRLILIQRPCVSMLVGIAPAHLDKAQIAEWVGGFFGRTLFVYAKRDRYDPTDVRQNEREMLALRGVMSDLRARLERMKFVQVGMRSEAAAEYVRWSGKLEERIGSKPTKIQALYERLRQNTLRVAAHYALSQGYDTIGLDSMHAAINYGEFVATSTDLVGEMLSDDQELRRVWRLRDFLFSHQRNRVSLLETMSGLGLSYTALKAPIESLRMTGELRKFHRTSNGAMWLERVTPDAATTSKRRRSA